MSLTRRQMGFALLPCSLMLLVVLMALTASLRYARLQRDLAQANSDLRRAHVAAQSSLTEGERRLTALFLSEMADESEALPATRFASSCVGSDQSGSTYPMNDQMNDQLHYQMDVLWSDKHLALCRVTATGYGRYAQVRIGLQAIFELVDCAPATQTLTSAEPLSPASSELSPDAAWSCKRAVRLRSWRALGEA